MNEFERTGMRSSILMLLPIEGQKVEGVDPSAFEEEIRDREQEPDDQRGDHYHQLEA